MLLHESSADREQGLELLLQVRDTALHQRYTLTVVPLIDIYIAREKSRAGDVDGAIAALRSVVEDLFAASGSIWSAVAVDDLVNALLRRGNAADLSEARAVVDRLAALPTDPGLVLHDIWLLRLRALLAKAGGDEITYHDFRDRYRKLATNLGFEGHMAMAAAMV